MKKTMVVFLAAVLLLALAACGAEGSTQKDYKTLEEAAEVVGFTPLLPAELPEGYAQASVTVFSGRVLQVRYVNAEEDEISVRAAQESTDDISGDYTAYSYTVTVPADGYEVLLKGMGEEEMHAATFVRDGLSYALFFQKAMDQAQAMAFIAAMA